MPICRSCRKSYRGDGDRCQPCTDGPGPAPEGYAWLRCAGLSLVPLEEIEQVTKERNAGLVIAQARNAQQTEARHAKMCGKSL